MSKHVQTFHLPSLKKKYSMHYRNVPSHVQTRYDKIWQVARCCVQQMLEYSPFWQLWLILLLQSTRARLASSASLLRWLFILCCSMSMDAPSRSPLASQFPRTAMRGHAGGFNSKGCSWSTWIVRCNEFVNPQSRDLQEPGISGLSGSFKTPVFSTFVHTLFGTFRAKSSKSRGGHARKRKRPRMGLRMSKEIVSSKFVVEFHATCFPSWNHFRKSIACSSLQLTISRNTLHCNSKWNKKYITLTHETSKTFSWKRLTHK